MNYQFSDDWWLRDYPFFWELYFDQSTVNKINKYYSQNDYQTGIQQLTTIVKTYIFYDVANKQLVQKIVNILDQYFKDNIYYDNMIRTIVKIVRESNWDNQELQKVT